MSTTRGGFDTRTELGALGGGQSVLLTGDDGSVLRDVFHRLVAAGESEASVVLSTDDRGRVVTRALDDVSTGASERTSVLACEGRGDGERITVVDDPSDLTSLGMELSARVGDARRTTDRVRVGIHSCSRLCEAAADTRSVYRFLNSNFLSQLRRGEAVGVCALDTSTDIGANVDSVVSGMETSFGARIDVVDGGPNRATLAVSGLSAVDDEEVELSL